MIIWKLEKFVYEISKTLEKTELFDEFKKVFIYIYIYKKKVVCIDTAKINQINNINVTND